MNKFEIFHCHHTFVSHYIIAIRNVPSRLHPPFRAKQLKRHMVTGEELGRRICGPEKLTDVHTLAKYLSVGTAADNKGHCQRELKRMIQVMSDKRREMPIFSAFSVLTEGNLMTVYIYIIHL